MENKKEPNYFVRILIVLLCIGIGLMIGFSFYKVEPQGVFKDGTYFLITLMLVLVLAESFDNFSIGKIISIQRQIKAKEEENKKLEKKNTELVSHLITITNTQTQKQQSNNIFGDYYSMPEENLQPKKSKSDNVQELLDRIGNSILITEFENRIKAELKEMSLEIESETDKVLLRHLAGTRLLLEFERVHPVIFGSQINLLKQLNSARQSGISEENVFAHFENVKQKFYENFKHWTASDYLSYLYSISLINKDENSNIHITNFGIEYLQWIVRNGLSEDKNL